MSTRDSCSVFPRGYLPIPCPKCGRARLEYGVNLEGGVIYVECEKCHANSDGALSTGSPAKAREAAEQVRALLGCQWGHEGGVATADDPFPCPKLAKGTIAVVVFFLVIR
jgi:hypothetical protein